MHMRRMQVQLDDDLAAAIEENALATGRSVAAVLREAARAWQGSQDRADRIARARAAIGGFHSGLGDVAERHDEYFVMGLAEEMRERWHR